MYNIYFNIIRYPFHFFQVESKDTGIAQSILSEWKSGRIKILGAEKLKILADYFDVPIEYFLE